jgi:hypothetical protein
MNFFSASFVGYLLPSRYLIGKESVARRFDDVGGLTNGVQTDHRPFAAPAEAEQPRWGCGG